MKKTTFFALAMGLSFLAFAPCVHSKNVYQFNPANVVATQTQEQALTAAKTQTQAQAAITLNTAETKAFAEVNTYLKSATQTDRDNLVNYLGYYRSWYQAVTPAPQDLFIKLSSNAKDLVKKIKDIAVEFTTQPAAMAGSSKLTKDGEKFYQDVIKKLKGGPLANIQMPPIKAPRTYVR